METSPTPGPSEAPQVSTGDLLADGRDASSVSDAMDRRTLDSSALAPGARLGEMEILRVIAVGGFGIVYLARDHSLDRDVALKEFMPSRLVGRKDGERVTVRSLADATTFQLGLKSFVKEARLLARFSHPAVVKVYRFWEANGTAYMAMPYLRGPTLKDVRRSMTEPPTEAWLRSVMDPLLDALAMLHAEGCYHRDIAPDNVLLPGPGQPVLLDFGAARHLIGDRTQSLTAVLKPHFAPIEQYAESRQLRQGAWTDLYALGALVKYLLDGKPPPASTARSIHDEMEVLAGRRIDGVSKTFLAAIDWALAVRPAERPQSVQALRDALAGRIAPPRRESMEVAATEPMASTEPSPAAAPTVRPPPIVPRRPRLRSRAALAFVAVAAAAAVAWALSARVGDGTAPSRGALVAAAPPAARAVREQGPPASPAPVTLPAAEVSMAPAAPVAMSTAAPSQDARVAEGAQALVAQRAENGAGAHARVARQRAAPLLNPARKHKPATHVATIGPLQLCAGRNVFLRSYCVRTRCDEPRFKSHPQCVQVRQAARTQRD